MSQATVNEFTLRALTRKDIENFEPPQPLFEGFPLYKGHSSLLTGESGAFKSLTSQSEAKSVLTGEPLFGKYKTLVTGPVFYIDEETPQSILKHRLTTEGLLPFIGKGLHYFHFPGLKVDNTKWVKELHNALFRIEPVFCVFDSLTRFHNQDEIKSTHGGMSGVMDVFRNISNVGPHVQVIHHFSKGSRKTTRGSSDIPAAVDIELMCVKANSFTKRFELCVGKTRIEAFEPICLRVIGLEGLMKDNPVSIVCEGIVVGELQQKIWELLKEYGPLLGKSSISGIRTISSTLEERKTNFTAKELNNALANGLETGDLKQQKISVPRSNGRAYCTEGYNIATDEPSFRLKRGASFRPSDAV